MDIELRRNREISIDDYFGNEKNVIDILHADMDKILNLIERMIVFATTELNEKNSDDLNKLGVVMESMEFLTPKTQQAPPRTPQAPQAPQQAYQPDAMAQETNSEFARFFHP